MFPTKQPPECPHLHYRASLSQFDANCVYQTRPAGVELDGVGIVAILSKEGGSELLLQKQYRPPIDKVVIEVPAGLIDAGETPEQCAVRELLEETGYVGEAEQTSPVMFNGELCLRLSVGRVELTVVGVSDRSGNV
jgi:8-oxo-dGTP pyrophosphatase MutT (NUDIX family)